jgi:hypothetical protein
LEEIRLGGSELTLGSKGADQEAAPPRRGSAQASNINFNATSVSQCWNAKIPSSRGTEASAVAAVAGVIPINL